jgi:GDP-L-fucose synthase
MNLKGKSVLLTGGSGFLARHLLPVLGDRGAIVHTPTHDDYDLTKPGHAFGMMDKVRPDIVIHAAARVGGIKANRDRPYAFGRDNLLMGINTLDAAIANNVEKFVLIGTACSYPSHCPVPFREDNLWNGCAEETNAAYGHAKRLLGDLIAAAVHEGRLKCGTTALPANLYGPEQDSHPDNSHVIPAMIRRMCEAVDQDLTEVSCWGSGRVTRDFLHVRDAAEGVVRVCEDWDVPYLINLGTGFEVSIELMANLVAKIVGYKGKILWRGDDLDGQRRRALECGRAAEALGWAARTDFETGLRECIDDWRQQCESSPQ